MKENNREPLTCLMECHIFPIYLYEFFVQFSSRKINHSYFFNNTTFDNLILNKSHSEISKEISENIINTFDNAREISKVLVKNNFGRLIFVNSTRALKGDVGTSGYSISKHGILGMMKSFSKELYTSDFPDPDLLIRTSGENRISNFLLWQIAYSEIYLTETYWPDFRERELINALYDYQSRERRFGKVFE